MAKQNEAIKETVTREQNKSVVGDIVEKKLFVEPTISVPVDVLEATTFFQIAESGATN